MTMGQRIAQRRKGLGLSQEALADAGARCEGVDGVEKEQLKRLKSVKS